MTFILGLTGSIGMGKSATSAIFRALGIPVYDADAAVHALYGGRAVPLIEKAFPGTVQDGQVDRARLGAQVLGSPERLKALEAIVHPLVWEDERAFLRSVAHHPLVVLDIPLLLEGGAENRCDAVTVVTAPAEVQAERVLSRPGMSREKFQAILDKQMPDADKRKRAHFLVDSSWGFESAKAQVRSIVACLAGRPGRVMGKTEKTGKTG